MAKEYKKKQRASKYEERLPINASFEDVIKITLSMEVNTLPAMVKQFIYPKGETIVISE